MTLAELSERIGITGRGNLSNLERGNVSPRLETLVKLAEGLPFQPSAPSRRRLRRRGVM